MLTGAQAESIEFPTENRTALAGSHCRDLSDHAANDDHSAHAQKKRSTHDRSSLIADRYFLNEYKALRGIAAGVSPVQAGVLSIVRALDTPTPLSPSTSSPTPSIPFPSNDNQDLPDYLTRKPASWRYLSDAGEVQAHFAHEAMEALGPVTGFTAWLSDDVNARAYASGRPLPWLRKRVAEALSAALGAPVEFLFAIEEERDATSGTYRIHLHGILGVDASARRRMAKSRAALRRALGTWEGPAKGWQIRFTADPDCGWTAYSTKRAWLATPRMRALFGRYGASRFYGLTFAGPAVTMTNGVRALAKQLHGEARQAVIEARTERPVATDGCGSTPKPHPPIPGEEARPVAQGVLGPAPADAEDTLARPVLASRVVRARSRGPPCSSVTTD